MQNGKFNVLVDSAWGSSGKGAASTRLADIHGIQNLSSCNYPNAGHCVVHNGAKWVFKVLPSGAALSTIYPEKQRPVLWVGPGSGFDIDQLEKEIAFTGYAKPDCEWPANVPDDIIIHDRAVIVSDKHIAAEGPGGVQSTLHVSSTMSGSGAAQSDKMMRKPDVKLVRDYGIGVKNWGFYMQVRRALERMKYYTRVGAFLHEVSQGFALSLNSGTHYPFCTSRECTPQQAYADFGLLPDMIGDVYLNIRSLPIRVGNNYDANGKQIGYSGDCMSDQRELTWQEIAETAEFPPEEAALLAEQERTTVTKKIRRVFTPSWELLAYSAKYCGATKLVLNFPQYIHWSAHKVRGGAEVLAKLHPDVRAYVDKMEEVTSLPVVLIGTGAEHNDYIYLA